MEESRIKLPLTLEMIEFWENEYLENIFHSLELDKQKMLEGFATKEEIREDWEQYLGQETSDFAVGSERIFYWLFNQFGQPNSSPIGSDMFFETYNAYVHIDIKTVTLSNLGDITNSIFVGNNQNSYRGSIDLKNGESRPYEGNLPTFYTKKNGQKKVCLTYFICILYDEKDLSIQTIVLLSMPNGELNNVYGNRPLQSGKNPGKVRYRYSQCEKFELLEDKNRIKVLLWNKNMDSNVKKRLKTITNLVEQDEIIMTKSDIY
ncbi:hypothetical protein [Psychrobacillus sp. L4]|uniref:hypothetical protein n=1 Tax=Psychrobacillus sp. L4 TaxID=3236892 RepID=UPI0036F2D7F5